MEPASGRGLRRILRHLRPPIATPHDTAELAEVEDAPWLFPHGTLAEAEARLARAVGAGELRVEPLAERIGVAVSGVTLADGVPPALATALRAALLVHKVLVFRDQPLDHAQHIAVARSFGQVTLGHIALRAPQYVVGGFPEVFELTREGVPLEEARSKVEQVLAQYDGDSRVAWYKRCECSNGLSPRCLLTRTVAANRAHRHHGLGQPALPLRAAPGAGRGPLALGRPDHRGQQRNLLGQLGGRVRGALAGAERANRGPQGVPRAL